MKTKNSYLLLRVYQCINLGGIVHLRCPHGVCVYLKVLLRQESARDYVDALASFAKQPRVIVSDIPSQVHA